MVKDVRLVISREAEQHGVLRVCFRCGKARWSWVHRTMWQLRIDAGSKEGAGCAQECLVSSLHWFPSLGSLSV